MATNKASKKEGLQIKSDGISHHTEVFYNGEKVGGIRRIEWVLDANQVVGELVIYFIMGTVDLSPSNGKQIKLMVANGAEIVDLSKMRAEIDRLKKDKNLLAIRLDRAKRNRHTVVDWGMGSNVPQSVRAEGKKVKRVKK